MLLDDPLQYGRVAGTVPGAFGIDDRDRSALADAQAVGLRAADPAGLAQSQLLEPRFQVFPRRQAPLLLAALGLGLVAAEEDVPPGDGRADRLGDTPLRLDGPFLWLLLAH